MANPLTKIIEIMMIMRMPIIVIGLIGNVISFLVYSRQTFKKNSISTYYRALAIFDCFIICDLITALGLIYFGTFYALYSDAACKTFYYISMAFASIPGWILIAFSIDKVLSMKRIGENVLKKKSFQYGIILAIVIINLLLYIAAPIYLELAHYNVSGIMFDTCDSATLPYISYIYLIEGSLLPFVILLTSSIVSIKLIRDSAKNIGRFTNTNHLAERNNRDFKYAITSVAFNISFILLKLPLSLVLFLDGYIPGLSAQIELLAIVGNISCIHYSSSFFIHLVSNSIFRREFLTLIRLYIPINFESFKLSRSNVVSVTNKKETSN